MKAGGVYGSEESIQRAENPAGMQEQCILLD